MKLNIIKCYFFRFLKIKTTQTDLLTFISSLVGLKDMKESSSFLNK